MKLKVSPFAWVSFAMIVGVMGAALISPLYPLYKDHWQLRPSDISFVYVVYMAGALCSFLFLGRLPDRVGFRRVMLLGLAVTLLGTCISMLAWNTTSLAVGRAFVGVASGLLTTSATMGLTALAPPSQMNRAASASGFLMAFGFGLGPLLGGITGQWFPQPLVTSYIAPLLLCTAGLVALWRLPLPASTGAASAAAARPLHWRDVLPRLTRPERPDMRAFLLTSALPFLAFGVFGLYASMSPLFLDKLVPWHGPIVSGTTIALILFASAGIQLPARRLAPHWCGFFGLLSLVLSNALLMLNLWLGSALLFGLGVLCTALGHGLCTLAGMRLVNRIAKPHSRSGLLSTYLVIGYIGIMAPMMVIGWIADHWGMRAAVSSFCVFVIVLGGVAAGVFVRNERIRGA